LCNPHLHKEKAMGKQGENIKTIFGNKNRVEKRGIFIKKI